MVLNPDTVCSGVEGTVARRGRRRQDLFHARREVVAARERHLPGMISNPIQLFYLVQLRLIPDGDAPPRQHSWLHRHRQQGQRNVDAALACHRVPRERLPLRLPLGTGQLTVFEDLISISPSNLIHNRNLLEP